MAASFAELPMKKMEGGVGSSLCLDTCCGHVSRLVGFRTYAAASEGVAGGGRLRVFQWDALLAGI